MTARKTQVKSSQNISVQVWVGFLSVLVMVMISATGVVYSTHKSRHLLNELQILEKQRNELQVVWGQLLLEQSSLVSQGRIEDRAIAELGMEIPVIENVMVIQRD
jgi:cell division protein FtsL